MAKFLERASFDWSEDSIRFINTPSPKAKSTFFYMQEAGYFKTTPPYFTERAGLPSFLIVYTLSGKGILHYGDDEYTLSNGQCFFINCMNHHDYETPPPEAGSFSGYIFTVLPPSAIIRNLSVTASAFWTSGTNPALKKCFGRSSASIRKNWFPANF